MGFPCGLDGKESICSVGDLGSIPGLGRSPGEGNSYPLQYSGLENSMDCIVHVVTKSQTRLSDFHLSLSNVESTYPWEQKHTHIYLLFLYLMLTGIKWNPERYMLLN